MPLSHLRSQRGSPALHPSMPDLACRLRTLQQAHVVRALHYASRALGRPLLSLEQCAVERELISPQETLPYRRPRLRRHHLDRITGSSADEPVSALVERLSRDTWSHAASTAYVLQDACLIGARLYAGRTLWNLDVGERPGWGQLERLDSAVLATTYAGTHWWGHCVHDDFPLQILAAERAGTPVGHARPEFADEAAYRRLFDVPAPRTLPGFFARRCTVIVDYAQNRSKRERYRRMRAALPRAAGPSTRVYLQRSGGAQRVLREEAELMERLDERGFTLLSNAHDSPERLTDVLSRASQVVSVDGSHASAAMLTMPEGAELCFIQPPDRGTDTMANIAQSAGLQTALFIGERSDGAGSFSVNVDELVAFIEEADPTPQLSTPSTHAR